MLLFHFHYVNKMNLTESLPPTHDYWQAWFDGSALPNPGKIGIGAVLLSPDGRRFEKSLQPGLRGCNNQAELHALCATLELAHGAGAQYLLVRGDSDVTIRYVSGQGSTKIAVLQTLVEQARAWLNRFEEVQLCWVPRHRNSEADHLCRLALGLPDKSASTSKKKKRRR